MRITVTHQWLNKVFTYKLVNQMIVNPIFTYLDQAYLAMISNDES